MFFVLNRNDGGEWVVGVGPCSEMQAEVEVEMFIDDAVEANAFEGSLDEAVAEAAGRNGERVQHAVLGAGGRVVAVRLESGREMAVSPRPASPDPGLAEPNWIVTVVRADASAETRRITGSNAAAVAALASLRFAPGQAPARFYALANDREHFERQLLDD